MPNFEKDDVYVAPKPPPKPKPLPRKPKNKVYYYFRGKRFTSRSARDRFASRYWNARKGRRPRSSLVKRLPQGDVDRHARLLQQGRQAAALQRELKRRADFIAKEKRRQAYINLRKRYGKLLDTARGSVSDHDEILAEKKKRQELLDPVLRQKKRAEALEARDRMRVRSAGHTRRFSQIGVQGDIRRKRLLEEARKTGDYEKLLRALKNDQDATGGRYMDRKLYQRALADFNTRSQEVDKRAADATEQAYSLAGWRKVNGVWTAPPKQTKAQVAAVRKYMGSSAYADAIQAWKDLYGDGRKGGAAHRVNKLFTDISNANDEYFTRAVFGYADASTRAQVDAARADIDKKLTRRRYGGTYKITLQQYLDELANEERMLLSRAQEQYRGFYQHARKEGFLFNKDGSFVSREWAQEILPVINRSVGNEAARQLLSQLKEGNSVDRDRALNKLIEKAMEQRRNELFKVYGTSQANKAEILRYLDAFRDKLYRNLTGTAAPNGIERVLGTAVQTPLIGEVLKGLGFLGGGLTGAIRYAQTGVQDGKFTGGRIQTADLNLSALTELGKPGARGLVTRDFHSSEDELKGEAQAKIEFGRAISEAGSDFGKIVEAIIAYGAEPFQGNIGNFVGAAALDPTIALNLTKFLKAGKLAKVRSGGIGALLMHPDASLADIYKLTLPKSLGGYGRSAVTLRETLADLRPIVGRHIDDVAGLTSSDIDTALRSLLEHPRTLKEATGFIEKHLKVTPANAAQILSSVQEYASKKGGAVGLRVADAAKFEAHLKAAESVGRVVPARAAAQVRRIRAEEAAPRDTALAVAAHEVRTGVKKNIVARAPKGQAKVDLDVARTEVRGLLDRQVELATNARKLSRRLRTSTDERGRIADYRKLTEVLDELDNITDASPDPRNPTTVFDRAQDRYQQALINSGSTRTTQVADLAHAEIVKDLRFVDSRISATRSALKTAAAADLPGLQSKLRDLASARRALNDARQRTTKQSKVAKEVVRRGRSKAETYIRRPRVAAKAATREGVLEEGSRDLYRRLRGSKVKSVTELSADQRKRVREAITKLERPVTWTPALDAVKDELDGLDLWESIVALDAVVAKGNTFYSSELSLLIQQAGNPKTIRRLLDAYRLLHNSLEGVDLGKFSALFKKIQHEFRVAGIAERKGSVRFYDQGPKKAASSNIDYGLRETVAKMKALRGAGISLHAYDEVRRPLGDAMVKINTSEGLRRRAIARAKKTGETFDEAYEVLYQQKLTEEAANALHEFAMRPAFRGSLPDEILDLWEESQLRQDLRVGSTEITPFLARSLRKAIALNSGIDPMWVDDAAYMGRVLGGQIEVPKGMRLATPGERMGIADSVPVFIAPSDHPHWPQAHLYRGNHRRDWGIVLNERIVSDGKLVKTVLHEYGHALWAAVDHQDPAAVVIMNDLGSILSLYGHVLKGVLATNLANPGEAMAEFYAMWIGRHADLDFIDVDGRPVRVPSWDDIRSSLPPNDQLKLDRVGAAFDQLKAPDLAENYNVRGFNVPPLTSRQEAYQWLVDNGFWARRTGQRIREGGLVWSIDQERDFFQTSFGFAPPWTDVDILRPALDDPRYFADLMTQFGYLDNGFEMHAAALNLDADGLAQAIAFGSHEAQGIKRGRTRGELRDWFEQRFGSLVTEYVPTATGGRTKRFRAAPWLMDAGSDEYKAFVDRLIDDGAILNPTLVKPEQMAKFKDAYKKAIDRRLERLIKKKRVLPGEDWLPQEQMRFAIDVTNELLMSREWRSFTERAPVGARGMRWVGELQRLLVVAQIAFPVMNLIDRFTVKQVLLMVANGGYRFWSRVDDDAARTLSELRSINIRERGIWDLRTASGWERLKNSELDKKTRALAIVDSITELGYQVSSWGEDSLKLNFAQRMYMQVRDDLVAEGVELEQARILALRQTRKKVLSFFPSLEDASDLERAINQAVPFLSYNLRNNILGMKIVAGHPYLWNLQNQIGALIEDSNRDAWERQNPGVELPDKYARRLLLRMNGEIYAVDFANFSDWFRGPERFSNESKDPDSVGEWIKTIFRAPHPVQEALAAWLSGGETPWGTQASVSSFLPLADFLPGLFGEGETAGMNVVEFVSKQLFFEAFAKVTPTEARAIAYFDLQRAGLRDQANRLLDAYPDVEMWIQEHTDPDKFHFRDSYKPSWFRGRTREEVRRYEEARAGLDAIRASFDAQLMALYDQPWSEEYKLLKKQRRAAVLAWTLEHRELLDARIMAMSMGDWRDQAWQWHVDDLIDDFFAQDEKLRPVRDDFKSELAYLEARRDYLDWRKEWMEANPDAADQITRGITSLERAWNQQQEHWREIERQQVEIRIEIAEEQAKGAKADKDLVNVLYDMVDRTYDQLDAEAFAEVYAAADGWLPKLRDSTGLLTRIVAGRFELPGRADFFYDRASETERENIRGTEAFFAKFNKIGGSKDFYGDLERAGILGEYLKRNPRKRINYEAWRAFRDGGPSGFYPLMIRRGFLDEYLAAHPGKRDNYERWAAFNGGTGTAGLGRYARGIMSIFRRAKDGRDFYRLLDADPWLRDEYFRRHPDRAAKFQAGRQYFNSMKRWVGMLEANRFEEATRYFNSLPVWIRERYYAKHPEQRRNAVASSGYAAALGKWVGFLKQGRYDEARAYFDRMPEAYRQRYFDAHPEARARHGGDDRLLDQARAYFAADRASQAAILARSPQFAAWLRENGGDEEKRRGLILAAYRAIAKDDAWLRRVFRERYPEIFSLESQGERRLKKVARNLAEHPEIVDLYERWVEAQYQAYREQFKLSVAPPKPFTMERIRRWLDRHGKRTARLSPLHLSAA